MRLHSLKQKNSGVRKIFVACFKASVTFNSRYMCIICPKPTSRCKFLKDIFYGYVTRSHFSCRRSNAVELQRGKKTDHNAGFVYSDPCQLFHRTACALLVSLNILYIKVVFYANNHAFYTDGHSFSQFLVPGSTSIFLPSAANEVCISQKALYFNQSCFSSEGYETLINHIF